MASLQQQLCDYAKSGSGPLPVLIRGSGYAVVGLVLVPSTGLPLVTVRKPTALRVYQVRGNEFEPRGSVTRPASYEEFEKLTKQRAVPFNGGYNGMILSSAEEGECKDFVVQFLKLNPEPTDKQVHELADAVGVDKETLEALIYKMLGDAVDHQVIAETIEEMVLEDRSDPKFGPTRLTTLNDEGIDALQIDEVQEDLVNDGLPRED